MSASPTDVIAAGLLSAIADAEALEALSRTKPHAFLEGKDGLIRKLKDVYADLRDVAAGSKSRSSTPSSAFRAGAIVRYGRVIPVQRRSGREPRC